jgi:hypothetical protein
LAISQNRKTYPDEGPLFVRKKTSSCVSGLICCSLYIRHDILPHELGGKRLDLADDLGRDE